MFNIIYKPFINKKLKRAWRKAWFFSLLVLFIACTVSAGELRTIQFVESTPILCLEDGLNLLTISEYRFQKPVSNRLPKASVFSALRSGELKSDYPPNKTFSDKIFLAILVIVLFFYYYHSAGEEGEQVALQF